MTYSARVANELPRHAVTFAQGFRLAVHEVTRAEFARFVAATGRDMAGCARRRAPTTPAFALLPLSPPRRSVPAP